MSSFIVSFYGLDGKREHFMPGNRRRGTGVREKRAFNTEAEARRFIDAGRMTAGSTAYLCGICGKWHTASPARRSAGGS